MMDLNKSQIYFLNEIKNNLIEMNKADLISTKTERQYIQSMIYRVDSGLVSPVRYISERFRLNKLYKIDIEFVKLYRSYRYFIDNKKTKDVISSSTLYEILQKTFIEHYNLKL